MVSPDCLQDPASSLGAGKTSLLNAIAGLLRPERGRIAIAGQVLFDSARRIDQPAHRRRIGYEIAVPMIYVSHNPDEVRRIANEVHLVE